MAEEYHQQQIGGGNSGNWWDSSSRNNNNNIRGSSSSPSSSALTSMSFGWPTEIVDLKPTSSHSIDNNNSSVVSHLSSANSILFQDHNHAATAAHKQQLQLQHADSTAAAASLADPNLQIMGLGLSNSPAIDWDQTLLHGGKSETSFRSVLQEDLNLNTNFQQENWRDKMYSSAATSEDSSAANHDYKQQILQMDHAAAAYGSSSTMFQGLLESPNQPQPGGYENRAINYPFPPPPGYGLNPVGELSQPPSWSKFPQFRGSPPKQQPQTHLQFSNNAPFWNATAASISDGRSGFFPSPQPQFSHIIEGKPKSSPEVREMASTAKKSSGDSSNKRQRGDAPSPLPAFKVRKEKMGDRITALQQLVSPFGKTDTASVLSEAIEYIKFLHEQVNVLSTPYMKSGAAMHQQQHQHHHHHQSSSKSKDPDEGPTQDLRSRGLCLVPISSTFPVTHETTVDFWTPTFGGTFR